MQIVLIYFLLAHIYSTKDIIILSHEFKKCIDEKATETLSMKCFVAKWHYKGMYKWRFSKFIIGGEISAVLRLIV